MLFRCERHDRERLNATRTTSQPGSILGSAGCQPAVIGSLPMTFREANPKKLKNAGKLPTGSLHCSKQTNPLCAVGTNEVDVPSYMKNQIRLFVLLSALFSVAALMAGPESRSFAATTETKTEKVSLDLFNVESG